MDKVNNRLPEVGVTAKMSAGTLRAVAELEERIVAVDALLKLAPGDPALEARRLALELELEPLADAAEFVEDVLPALPVCLCGKARHASRESAERHLAALRLTARHRLSRDPGQISGSRRKGELETYACFREAELAWHVGTRMTLVK